MPEHIEITGPQPVPPPVGSRRRFLRRAAVVGLGGATALLVPVAVGAEDKESKGGGKPKAGTPTPTATVALVSATATATATPTATATITATPSGTAGAGPTPTAPPVTPSPARPVPALAADQDDSLDGDEVYGAAPGRRRATTHQRERCRSVRQVSRGGRAPGCRPTPDGRLRSWRCPGGSDRCERMEPALQGGLDGARDAARRPGRGRSRLARCTLQRNVRGASQRPRRLRRGVWVPGAGLA